MSASDQSVVHTPGPWEFHASVATVRALDDEMTVCEIKGWGYLTSHHGAAKATDEMDANGRLIAAAPTMREILLDFCDSLGDNDCIPTHRQILAKKAALALLSKVV